MIERAYGKIALACDDCGDETQAQDPEDFDVLIDKAKSAGWKITKEGGEWCHYCSDCAET